jgi:hypothetical protein
MDEQNIPLGRVDLPHAHRPGRSGRGQGWWARHWHLVAAGLGLLAAGGGVILSTNPSEFTVGMTPHEYRLGSARLAMVGAGSYSGSEGSMVQVRDRDRLRAGGSTGVRGLSATGQCVLIVGADHESCLFVMGSESFTATDTRTSYGWLRRYDDGRQVRIAFDGGDPVPVPFPIGR